MCEGKKREWTNQEERLTDFLTRVVNSSWRLALPLSLVCFPAKPMFA